MTKSNITEYDNTAANNTDVEDVPLGESAMFPSHVNNAFREIMADLADINDGTVTMTSPSATSLSVTNNITVGGTVDGRDVATDGTKLDGIEANATADQTAAEIRTLVDSATDSNVFTDADHTKLDAIAASATANPNAIDNVVEDTTPQLGGNLDTNGNSISFGTSQWTIELGASNRLDFNYNGTTVFSLSSNGAVISANDITAFGTP